MRRCGKRIWLSFDSGLDLSTPEHIQQLAQALQALGCPAEKCSLMAAQLDKRARQLSDQKSVTYEEAMVHLLNLMKQGWAAQLDGTPPPAG